MSQQRKEIVLDTDRMSFVLMALATFAVCLSLARDVYRWAHGRWVVPLERPSGFLEWYPLVIAVLMMGYFVVMLRTRETRPLRFGSACILARYSIRVVLFFIPTHSELATTLTYIRPAFSAAGLIFLLVWLVSWFRGVVVHG